MKRLARYVVIPFRFSQGRLHQAELRPASSEAAAVRMAELMAERFAGVIAFEVHVDIETGEMHDPRELVTFGRIPALDEDALQVA